jgi:hypothetical protein
MAARREVDDAPESFRAALVALRSAPVRPEVVLAEAPAPRRLAPWAVALTADVVDAGREEMATGRLVLLHDPAGHEAWNGVFRLVTFLRAALEPEIVADPMLPRVGWTWLEEALVARGAAYAAASGTVTRVVSESFGAMANHPSSAEIEIRASWTPLDQDVAAHLTAWSELLCTAAGLPPVPAGVLLLSNRRGQRGR